MDPTPLPPMGDAEVNSALRLIAALSNPDAVKKAIESVRNERGNADELYRNASDAQMKADALNKQANEMLIVAEAKALDNQSKAETLSKQADFLAGKATELSQARNEFDRYSKATTDDFTKREVALSAREQSVDKREQSIAAKEQEAQSIKAEYEAKLSAIRNAVA